MNKHPNNNNSNVIRFHLHISTTLPLWQLKRNTSFYAWLTKGRIFLHTHGFTMTYDILSAGFLSNLSPTMHHCDTMKDIIDAAAHDKGLNLDIHLVPCNIPYGQNKKKHTTNAVEVLVDHASVNIVCEMMIELFQMKPDVKVETNAMQMFNNFGQRFQVVMQKLEELVVECKEIKSMIKDKMTQILKAIQHPTSGDINPTIGNTPHQPQKIS